MGLLPEVVVGHSSGEIAAAYAAGALSFEDAMTVSYHRGRLASDLAVRQTDSPGAMLAVGASAETMRKYFATAGLGPSSTVNALVACYNSPASVTVSGALAAIDRLVPLLEGDGVFQRKLRTHGIAYHSEQMHAIECEYAEALAGVVARAPSTSVRMVSSVRGTPLDGGHLSGDYWTSNLVSPVRFADALTMACANIHAVSIVEVGPHSQLSGAVRQTLQGLSGTSARYTTMLDRKINAEAAVMGALGELAAAGHCNPARLNMANQGFTSDSTTVRDLLIDVPAYTFDHSRRFWHESRISSDYTHRVFPPHPLLGNPTADINTLEPRWRRFLRLSELPWLRGHMVQGDIVFPAAGYLTMAIEALRRRLHPTLVDDYTFHNVAFHKALIVSDERPDAEVSLSLRPHASSARTTSATWMEFRVFSVAPNQPWTEYCRGLISAQTGSFPLLPASRGLGTIQEEAQLPGAAVVRAATHPISSAKFYHLARERGLDWQDLFAGARKISAGPTACLTEVAVEVPGADGFLLHPAVLDVALFHGLCAILYAGRGIGATVVPTFITDMVVSASVVITQTSAAANLRTYCTGSPADGPGTNATGKLAGSVSLQNEALDTLVLATVRDVLAQVPADQVMPDYRRHLYAWMQDYAATATAAAATSPPRVPSDRYGVELGVLGEAIRRLSPEMANVLRGEANALSILTPDNLLARLYSEERCPRCYSQIAAFCQDVARQSPVLKVAEVGGGTASASLEILSALHKGGAAGAEHGIAYHFTDVSPGFFSAAQERLGDFADVVSYSVLDIERNPAEQGFETGIYDIVIACNVLYATSNIDASLAHVRALLRPGGTLILMEITQDQSYYSAVFGAFAGWWAGAEEGRLLSPLLTAPEWSGRLGCHGFDIVEPCLADYPDAEGGTISVFLARRQGDTAPGAILAGTDVELVGRAWSSPPLALQQELARLLHPHLEGCSSKVTWCNDAGPQHADPISIFLPDFCESLGHDVSGLYGRRSSGACSTRVRHS
ncbi:hypothetical protein LTR49_028096 [Elasticomyces elasticus]|nr:hypothetical protein LTR49_028096 [Elasticomyces elasticus]